MAEITKSTLIGDLILNSPGSVEVLMKYGFHCIGCGLASYETIEEGAMAHGLEEKDIDELISELKKAASAPLPPPIARKEGHWAKIEEEHAKLECEKAKKEPKALPPADKMKKTRKTKSAQK